MWDVSQELNGFLGRPAERVKDLTRIDEGLQPRTGLRRSLHGKEQRQQTVLVCRSGIFAKSLPQWEMLSLRIRRQPRGVGGQKSERRIRIFAVLGQIEVHPADQVPRRVPALQEFLYPALRLRQFDAECGIQFLPEGTKDLRAQILRASHRRGSQNQPVQLRGGRRRDRHFPRRGIGIRVRTKGGHVPCAEFSPVGEDRRNRASGFSRSEL